MPPPQKQHSARDAGPTDERCAFLAHRPPRTLMLMLGPLFPATKAMTNLGTFLGPVHRLPLRIACQCHSFFFRRDDNKQRHSNQCLIVPKIFGAPAALQQPNHRELLQAGRHAVPLRLVAAVVHAAIAGGRVAHVLRQRVLLAGLLRGVIGAAFGTLHARRRTRVLRRIVGEAVGALRVLHAHIHRLGLRLRRGLAPPGAALGSLRPPESR
mmetsp:Transcript_136998/g.381952  ORF Transcript_136998/g.381952 Transcript_136998/m.381952 type:complete len:211 (+) Transcript_136998:150-782(+)